MSFWRALQLAGLMISTLSLCGCLAITYFYPNSTIQQTLLPSTEAPRFGVLLAGLDVQYCTWATSKTPARRCSENEKSPIDTGSRTDTLIFIEFDRTQVHLLSLPRDTQVGDEPRKINASYKLGGSEQLVKDVESLLGKRIDYYVLVKTEYVEQVIDALGGLDVSVPQGQQVHFSDHAAGIDFHLNSGQHHLNGRDAVLFLRIRKGFGDDYGRMDRQKTAISQLLNQLRSPKGLQALPTLVSGFSQGVETNADPNLLNEMIPHLQGYRLSMSTLPTYEIEGSSNLKIDRERYEASFSRQEEIPTHILKNTQIRLIDGSGIPNLGQRLSRYLNLRGLKIDQIENASIQSDQSQVVTYNRSVVADQYAQFLGFPRLEALRLSVHPGEVLIYLGEDAGQRFAALKNIPLS